MASTFFSVFNDVLMIVDVRSLLSPDEELNTTAALLIADVLGTDRFLSGGEEDALVGAEAAPSASLERFRRPLPRPRPAAIFFVCNFIVS